ncbi:MAG: hypothetical protein V7K18_09705 [Nostoc sp.]|uniref:hypothetical protein n=1 Tax=Nostoc sp. TaxID=1180 RepID=UPI002FF6D3EE
MGIKDWGLGNQLKNDVRGYYPQQILECFPSPQSPVPSPQSPVPSPQSPVPSPQSPVPLNRAAFFPPQSIKV